jgi:uncharacterized integral membrane protein
MKFIVWPIRILLFLVLLVLTMNNTHHATLHLFGAHAWTAPLILIGFVFFVAGLLAGWLIILPALWRHKMTAYRLKRELNSARSIASPSSIPLPLQEI